VKVDSGLWLSVKQCESTCMNSSWTWCFCSLCIIKQLWCIKL